jgi:hypothetical protein
MLDPDARSSNHINAPQNAHTIFILPLSSRSVGVVSGFRPRYCKVEITLACSATAGIWTIPVGLIVLLI